jgi:hypothetical protein
MWSNFNWAPAASDLYFAERDDVGVDCIVRLNLDAETPGGRQVLTCAEEPSMGFGDLRPAPSGDLLGFVHKADGLGNGGEVKVLDLDKRGSSVVVNEFGTGSNVFIKGWRRDGSLVVLSTVGDESPDSRLSVYSLRFGEEMPRSGLMENVRGANVEYDEGSDSLLVAREVDDVWRISRFSMLDQSEHRLIENTVPGIVFAGFQRTTDGNLLVAKKEERMDIWRIVLNH